MPKNFPIPYKYINAKS